MTGPQTSGMGAGGMGASGMGTRRSGRLWWAAFVCLTCMGAVWALAVPPMTGTDEAAHAVRAAAVARGEWVGRPAGAPFPAVNVRVPEAFALAGEAGTCFAGDGHYHWDYRASQPRLSDCVELDGTAHEVDTMTYEHRIQPTSYVLTGLPTLFHHGEIGFYLMRLVGLVPCSALLATGLIALLRVGAPRVLVVGAFLTLPPAVIYFRRHRESKRIGIERGLLCLG